MGKSVPSPSKLQNLARIITSNRLNNRPNQIKPVPSKARPVSSSEARPAKPSGLHKAESSEQHQHQHRLKNKKMEVGNSNSNANSSATVPLAEVVADCVKRWFQDTLKEAKAGDAAMQVLVGQMYFSGYGVPRDAQKGRAWINRASKSRSSAWKVGDKHPGYNASDSDSDDGK